MRGGIAKDGAAELLVKMGPELRWMWQWATTDENSSFFRGNSKRDGTFEAVIDHLLERALVQTPVKTERRLALLQ